MPAPCLRPHEILKAFAALAEPIRGVHRPRKAAISASSRAVKPRPNSSVSLIALAPAKLRGAGRDPLWLSYDPPGRHPRPYAALRGRAGRIADYLRESVMRRAEAQYIARLVSAAQIEGVELSGAEALRVH